MLSSLVTKFAAVLDGVLSKLSRYDEGTFFSSILSFTVSTLLFVPANTVRGFFLRLSEETCYLLETRSQLNSSVFLTFFSSSSSPSESLNLSGWNCAGVSDLSRRFVTSSEREKGEVCVSSLLQKPGMDLADTYITFIRQNQDILRDRVNDELYTEKVFEQWYSSSVKLVCVWLTDRMDLQLHVYQLKTLIKIVKKTYRDFRLQGVLDVSLNNKSYETVYNRLTVEEATAAVKSGDGLQGISMRDSDQEDD
ncbi:hypothetical protein F7725_023334 [Dissostichus mawsoni]|uniref:MUN domain-containing protein n=1 Tax=Dissostichus mawsoni TaxID=36200 RepID=A0A7J5Z2J9_DISMA|nr:hypothetical protein F7725_023334 [Dissostichus mawsoni]